MTGGIDIGKPPGLEAADDADFPAALAGAQARTGAGADFLCATDWFGKTSAVMSYTLQPFRSLVFAVSMIVVLGTACHTTKDSAGDDLAASMRETRTQVIEQMRAAGASASQIREVEKQLDKVEREARRMENQMEKLEKQDQ